MTITLSHEKELSWLVEKSEGKVIVDVALAGITVVFQLVGLRLSSKLLIKDIVYVEGALIWLLLKLITAALNVKARISAARSPRNINKIKATFDVGYKLPCLRMIINFDYNKIKTVSYPYSFKLEDKYLNVRNSFNPTKIDKF